MSNVSMVDGHIDENKMTDIKKLTEDLEYARYHCTSNKGKDAINDALDLINRQQAENDNWEKQFRILDVECSRLEKKTEEQQAEIERLKNANDSFTDIGKLYSEIKAEAIKEFAERLKERRGVNFPFTRTVFVEDIDNLVKEMVGEE